VVDPKSLLEYMERFIGFGEPTARVWFIGLEQGGGEDLAELERRLDAWRQSGGGPFADLREYCERLGERRWHGPSPRIQPTLGKLVRLMLALEGVTADTENVRSYQAEKFGRVGGGSVIAELMPLPSRNVSQWIYGSLCDVPSLETRDSYVQRYRPVRVALIRDALRAANPRAVVFLGTSEKHTWAEIAGSPFVDGPAGASWAEGDSTRFVVLTHPTAYGATNAYFERVGRELAA
jgi:hypothetical protein